MGTGSQPAPLGGVLETAVYVDDLYAAETFYAGVLGLPVILRREGRHAFFRCGSTIVLAFLPELTRRQVAEGPMPIPPHGADGASHVCFSVTADQMDRWIETFQAAGIEIEADFHWENGARSIYVRDPSGNSVELAQSWLWEVGQ